MYRKLTLSRLRVIPQGIIPRNRLSIPHVSIPIFLWDRSSFVFFASSFSSSPATGSNTTVLSSIANLSPTQIASLNLEDRISLARLGRLPIEKRQMVPLTFFIFLTRSFYQENETQLNDLPLEDLAELYIGLRKGLATTTVPGASSSLTATTTASSLPTLPTEMILNNIEDDKILQHVLRLLEKLVVQHPDFLTLSTDILQDIYTLVLTQVKSPTLQTLTSELTKRNISVVHESPSSSATSSSSSSSQSQQHQQHRKEKQQQQQQNKRKSRAGGFSPVTGTVLAVGTVATIASLWNRLYSSTLTSSSVTNGRPPGKVVELLENATPESIIALVRFILASTDVSDLAPQQAQTLVAAATNAMLRSGLGKYTNEQLVALAKLLPFHSSNSIGYDDTTHTTTGHNSGGGASALIPRKFWDMFRNEIANRDPLSFQCEERITLAYVLTRVRTTTTTSTGGTSSSNTGGNTTNNSSVTNGNLPTSNDISYRLLSSLSPNDLEKCLSVSGTLIQQYAFTSSFMKFYSLTHLQALSKAIIHYQPSQDSEHVPISASHAAVVVTGPGGLAVPILWDILQLFSRCSSIFRISKDIQTSIHSIVNVLENQCKAKIKGLDDVNTRTLLNMLVSRATWKTSVPSTESTPSFLKKALAKSKNTANDEFTNVWMLLSNDYAEYLMMELSHRLSENTSKARSNPMDQLDNRRLLLSLWMGCKQIDVPGAIPIITSISKTIHQRQLNLDEHPFQLIQVCECIPPLVQATAPGSSSSKSLPKSVSTNVAIAQVQLLQSIERGIQSTANNNGLSRYDLGACIRIFNDMMSIDTYLRTYQQVTLSAASSRSSSQPTPFTVAYTNEDILRYRNNIVRFCTAIATEISGRLQGTIVRSNKPAYLTRAQRQKLLQSLQNISSLAVYDGLQANKNIDALNAFTSLQALLNVNGNMATMNNNSGYPSSTTTKSSTKENSLVTTEDE